MNRRDMLKLSSFAAAAISVPALAETSDPVATQSSIKQWDFIELMLAGPSTGNPFVDVHLSAEFRSGDRVHTVAGFYDGDGAYKIRFMPDELGAWSWTTASNTKALEGHSGTFNCVEPGAGNRGPVSIAKTYHFSYADGTPYFLLGTTLYNWINRDEELQRQTLETLSRSPFTKIRFGLFPKWYEFNHVEPKLYPYIETASLQFDLDRFNPLFFHAVEKRLADLQKLGIEADIILFHPYDHLGFATMDADHDDAYIRYVCARLSAFRNVWWTMANEYDLFDPKMIPGKEVKDWDRMFQVLEASDPYRHPRGIHNMGDWYDHCKPWITHAIIQDGGGHPGRRLPAARAKYKKPVVVDEYGYEGNNGNGWGNLSGAEEVSRHWEITMAGGYGSHGETYVHPGGILWWAVGGTLVGESPARLNFLKRIMTEAPFQEIAPAPALAQGGALLALEGEYYLLRVKERVYSQHIEIQLKKDAFYQVDLIDPWLMKVYKLGSTPGGLQAFDAPITPSLLRFGRVDSGAGKEQAEPIQTLLARFLKDPTIEKPPAAVAIQQPPRFYSTEYTIGELEDNARTSALVKKYLPNLPQVGFVRALTVEQLSSWPFTKNMGDLHGLARELEITPLDQ